MRSSHLIASERKETSGRRNSMCKGPEVGNFSSCLGRERDSEKPGRWNGGKLAYSKGRKYALNKTCSLLTMLWNLDVVILVLPGWCSGKASAYNSGDTQETRVWSLEREIAPHSSIPAWENSLDRGAWRATVHVVAQSRTWLSTSI